MQTSWQCHCFCFDIGGVKPGVNGQLLFCEVYIIDSSTNILHCLVKRAVLVHIHLEMFDSVQPLFQYCLVSLLWQLKECCIISQKASFTQCNVFTELGDLPFNLWFNMSWQWLWKILFWYNIMLPLFILWLAFITLPFTLCPASLINLIYCACNSASSVLKELQARIKRLQARFKRLQTRLKSFPRKAHNRRERISGKSIITARGCFIFKIHMSAVYNYFKGIDTIFIDIYHHDHCQKCRCEILVTESSSKRSFRCELKSLLWEI